jgi:hypothetical protein
MNPKLKKWLRWLEVVKNEVRELIKAKYTYHEILNMIDNNPLLNKQSNLFYEYLAHTYVSHVVIGVRRQIKCSKQSISIIRLLREMSTSPQILSRKYFVALYKPSTIDWANEDFNQFASSNSVYIDSSLVANDLTSLRNASRRLEGFADKHVAHRDQSGLKDPPTFNDVDSCIDLLDKLYVKYHFLFHAKLIDTLFTEPKHEWKNIFRVPWLPSTEHRIDPSD